MIRNSLRRYSQKFQTPFSRQENVDIYSMILANDLASAKQEYTRLEAEGKTPTVYTFGKMVTAYSKINQMGEAEKIFQKMKDKKQSINIIIYTSMINGYVSQGKVDSALKILAEMKEYGVEPNSFGYNCIIKGYTQKGDMSSALSIFEKMKTTQSSQPELITYNTLIEGFARLDDIVQAERYAKLAVKEGFELDIHSYSSLLRGYSNVGDLVKIKATLDELISKGLEPNIITYGVIIDGYARFGKLDAVLKAIDHMKRSGLQPNYIIYTSLIAAYAAVDDFPAMKALLQPMRNEGFRIDDRIYAQILRYATENSLEEMVPEILEEMKKDQVSPSSPYLLDRLMAGRALVGDYEGMMELYKQYGSSIQKELNVRSTSQIIMRAFALQGKISELNSWFHKTFPAKASTTPLIYNTMVRGYARSGMFSEAIHWVEQNFARTGGTMATFYYLIAGCCKFLDCSTFQQRVIFLKSFVIFNRGTFNLILQSFHEPTPEHLSLLSKVLGLYAKPTNAFGLVKLVDSFKKCELDQPQEWLSEWSQLIQQLRARSTITDEQIDSARQVITDVAAFTTRDEFVKGFWSAFKSHEFATAEYIFDQMRFRDFSADLSMYQSLISSFITRNELDNAQFEFTFLKEDTFRQPTPLFMEIKMARLKTKAKQDL